MSDVGLSSLGWLSLFVLQDGYPCSKNHCYGLYIKCPLKGLCVGELIPSYVSNIERWRLMKALLWLVDWALDRFLIWDTNWKGWELLEVGPNWKKWITNHQRLCPWGPCFPRRTLLILSCVLIFPSLLFSAFPSILLLLLSLLPLLPNLSPTCSRSCNNPSG